MLWDEFVELCQINCSLCLRMQLSHTHTAHSGLVPPRLQCSSGNRRSFFHFFQQSEWLRTYGHKVSTNWRLLTSSHFWEIVEMTGPCCCAASAPSLARSRRTSSHPCVSVCMRVQYCGKLWILIISYLIQQKNLFHMLISSFLNENMSKSVTITVWICLTVLNRHGLSYISFLLYGSPFVVSSPFSLGLDS